MNIEIPQRNLLSPKFYGPDHNNIGQKWTMPLSNWGVTAQKLAIWFPDLYTIEFNTKGSTKTGIKYYLKGSLTKKLREIPIEFLYPRINDPH